MFNSAVYIHTSTTTHVTPLGQNTVLFSVSLPLATTGTVTLQSPGGASTYMVFPIGSIGCFLLKSVCGNGLDVVTSAGDVAIVSVGV